MYSSAALAAQVDGTTTAPATRASSPATQDLPPTTRPAYSAPGRLYRHLDDVGLTAIPAATLAVTGAGRELAESSLRTPIQPGSTPAGLPGLAAPPPVTRNAIVALPGLQFGRAFGLTPASQINTVLRPRVNPISGLDGGCQRLANAGFFAGHAGTCRSRFHR